MAERHDRSMHSRRTRRRARLRGLASTALLACSVIAGGAPAAADGGLDPSFASTGLLVADFTAVNADTTISALTQVLRDRAGRWLGAGSYATPGPAGVEAGVLFRRLADGRLDPSFGTGGLVTSVGPHTRWHPLAVTELLTGELAVSTQDVGMLRLSPAGVLLSSISFDAGFGPSPTRRLVTLPDGRLLVPGHETRPTALGFEFVASARIVDPEGDGGTPTVRLAPVPGAPAANHRVDVAVDASGRIYVGGCTAVAPAPACAISAYAPDGAIDTTFGSGGVARLTVDGSEAASCSFDVAPDGFIATACSSVAAGSVKVAELDASGATDPSFTPVTLAATQFDEAYSSVRAEGTGRVLVTVAEPITVAQTDAVVHAYLPDGSVDGTFGTAGAVPVRQSSVATGLAVDDLGGVSVWGMPQDRTWSSFWIASLDATDGSALQPPLASTASFVPVTPTRVLDTRVGTGAPAAKPGTGATVVLHVAGVGPIPANGLSAVALNVTATEASAPGYVTVWPSGSPRPIVSNLNLGAAGETNANLVIVPVGADGSVEVFTQTGTHLVADVSGYFAQAVTATAGRYRAAPAPFRVLDTRDGTGAPRAKPGAGGRLDVQIAGIGPLPSTGVSAVVMNVTGTEAAGDGFVTAWPAGSARPDASSLNLARNGTRANLVIVPVGPGGAVSLFTQSGTHLVADVAGWFTDATAPAGISGLFVPIPPRRMLDTRITPGAVPAGGLAVRSIGGTAVVPAGLAGAVVANITATGARAPGYVTATPAGTGVPLASTLNLPASGATVPNAAIVGLGQDGIALYSQSGTDLIVDISGWFVA